MFNFCLFIYLDSVKLKNLNSEFSFLSLDINSCTILNDNKDNRNILNIF